VISCEIASPGSIREGGCYRRVRLPQPRIRATVKTVGLHGAPSKDVRVMRALPSPPRWLLALAVATVIATSGATVHGQPSPQYPKRGWGGTASRYPSDAMNPNWYYNWGRTAIAGASSEFVPMAWGSSSVTNDASFGQLLGHSSEYILGFNEPERADQANMTVAEAIALWPRLMTTGKKLVSPAVSDDATGRAWLTSFLSEINRLNLRVDAVAFHWYGDVRSTTASTSFLNRVDWFHNAFANTAGQKYPIWITEFGGIDWTGGVNPVTQEMNAQFLAGALPGLDSRSHVQRYAWFGWRDETSLGGGTPFTPTAAGDLYNGRTYATGQTVTLVGDEGSDTFYLRGGTIQNSGSSKVIQALDAIEGTSRLQGDGDWGVGDGWMRIRAGATVAKYGASTFQVSGVRLTNDGNFYGKSGTMAFADGTIIDGTGVLRTEWSASPACGITLTESAPGRGGVTIHNRVWLNGGQFTVATGSHSIRGELQISSASYATIGGTLTLTAPMTGPGSLGKTGAGTLRLEAASVNTGTFAVWAGTLVAANETGSVHGTGPLTIGSSGTLAGNGSIGGTGVSIVGTLAPSQATGSPRPLTFSSPVTFAAGSRTILDIGAPVRDSVVSSSTVALAGSLALVPQSAPATLVPYEFLTAAALRGRYASIAGIDLVDGRRLAVTYTATSAVVTAAMAGDTNLDGSLDILDAAAFASSACFDAGTLASWADGDFNGDGLVDVLDAADFATSGLFDAGAYAATVPQVAAVPEPSAGLLAGAVACLSVVITSRRWPRGNTRRPPRLVSAVGGGIILLTLAAVMAAATATAQVPTGYTIEAFSDEFDGVSLDTTKWNAGIINYPSGSTWLWRNHPGNNAVAGGFLIQTTLYQDVTGDGVPEWTCSSVGARSFSQRFGYWESRIRITDFNWTDNAWWSSDIGTGHLSGMDGFEIDAPEAWSPNRYTASIYDHAVQGGSAPSSIHFGQTMTGKNFTENFSVFGWDWSTDNSVKCFVDGTLVHTFSAADMNGIEALVPQGPVQGTALWTTGLTPSNQVADGDSKFVDYVRVYQKPGWSGTGSVKHWGDAANWGLDGVPASGRAAVFNTAAATGTIALAADQPVQEIVFQGGDTGATTIAGPGRLLLGMTTAVTATTGAVGGINLVNDTSAGVTVIAEIVAQRKLQFSNFAGASITPGPTPGVDLVLAGRLSATNAGTPINFLTTAPVVVNGTIDGSIGRITKGGQGVVRLNAANAFTGALEIRDGIVEVNADGALGAVGGGVTMSPGSIYDQPSLLLNAVAYSDPVPIAIRGGGTRTAHYPQTSGALESSGTSRFAGPITAIDDATIFVQRGGHLTLSGTIDTREHAITLGALGKLVVAGRVTGSTAGQID
jgi:autotransporter-associated beta strand protein